MSANCKRRPAPKARMAGITIAPERLPGAAERLNEMLDFLHQLDELELGDEPPASVFDPSWEVESA